MARRNVKLRWAQKILRSKNFVVLTDKESVIALVGVDPTSFTDLNMLREQAASLESFMYQMKELQVEHDKAIESLVGGGRGRKKNVNKRAKAPSKKKG